jgi:hypothetical protein
VGEELEYNVTFAAFNVGLLKQFVRRKSYSSSERQDGLLGRQAHASALHRGVAALGLDEWLARTLRAWQLALGEMPSLPDPSRYSPETWEWALTEQWATRLYEDGSDILTVALERDDTSLMAYAALLMERAAASLGQERIAHPVHKAIGVAYVQMLHREEAEFRPNALFPAPPHAHLDALFGQHWRNHSKLWRSLAHLRAYEAWARFVAHHDAHRDPQWRSVEGLLDGMRRAAQVANRTLAAANSDRTRATQDAAQH